MDEGKIKEAARLFLEGIGEDPAREGLLQTPERIARMCHELFAGYTASAEEHLATRFAAPGGGIVVERDIRFYSVCEHHLLPFFGRAAIAYLPQGEVVGLSKLARTVEVFARRLQLQERLTAQVAAHQVPDPALHLRRYIQLAVPEQFLPGLAAAKAHQFSGLQGGAGEARLPQFLANIQI